MCIAPKNFQIKLIGTNYIDFVKVLRNYLPNNHTVFEKDMYYFLITFF